MNKHSMIASALKAAKPFLAKSAHAIHKEQFICYAILRAEERGKCEWHETILARRMIMERLCGRYNIECWLQNRIGYQKYFAAKLRNPDVIQEYRHRWLDELIREFSEKS